MIFYDSETTGLNGIMVLLQLAEDDGPVELIEIWKQPVRNTLHTIEWMMDNDNCGFNLSFDHYQLMKVYNIFRLMTPGELPNPRCAYELQQQAIDHAFCLKPKAACDLLLWARKGKYQNLMRRAPIRIRKVPRELADVLALELEKRVEIDGIFFAKSADGPRWKVYDREDDPFFKDVVLHFNPAGGLKYLAEYALGHKPNAHFKDIESPKYLRPQDDIGYHPTACRWMDRNPCPDGAPERASDGFSKMPVVEHHIQHWAENEDARTYAKYDVIYTRELYEHLGSPEPGDDDSELAIAVACSRYKGFEIDCDRIKRLREESLNVYQACPININSTKEVRAYIEEVLTPIERVVIAETTEKAKLEEILDWGEDHNSYSRVKEVLDAKVAAKEINLFDKLLSVGRIHPDLNVIGTKSSRMSGTGGLSLHSTNSSKKIRECFPMKWENMAFSLGDFSAFEFTLADAVFDDDDLRENIKSGKKIHALFGMCLYPGMTYDDVLADKPKYGKAKAGVYSLLYGGNDFTLHKNLGVSIEVAEEAMQRWLEMFPGIAAKQEEVNAKFATMQQHEGGHITFDEPADYVETFLGFKRDFTLENKTRRAIYELANNPPKEWRDVGIKVMRRPGRLQTGSGATQSALFGAAFAIQGAIVRAAGNHLMQSTGAEICKSVQRKVWDIQPSGVSEFVVSTLNLHDEVHAVHQPDLADLVEKTIHAAVETYRDQVPLIEMDWVKGADSWASK